MTMASGRLVYATTTGTLNAVDFTSGAPTIMGGPTIDGQSWQSRALFLLNLPN